MPTSEYEYHPYADLFPLMGDDELKSLAEDIGANGLREKIVRHEGKVLDGRNRLRACELADVDPRFADYEGDDPLGFVVSKNLHRRHLTESQRAMVAARMANFGHGGDRKADQAANLPLDIPQVSQAKSAELLNVSERTVRDAKKVQADGVPELAAAVESGEVSVSAAAKVAELPKADQRKAVKGGAAGVRDAAKKPAGPPVSDELVGKVAAALRRNPDATDHALAGVCDCTAAEAKAARKKAKKLPAADPEPTPAPPPEPGKPAPLDVPVLTGVYTPRVVATRPGHQVVLDAYDNPTPPGVGDCFADPALRDRWLAVTAAAEVLEDEYRHLIKDKSGMDPAKQFPWVDIPDLQEHVRTARNALAAAADLIRSGFPHAVCPKCWGSKCKECRMSGFWPIPVCEKNPALFQKRKGA